MSEIDNHLNLIHVQGPLGNTSLDVKKYDHSGCFCIEESSLLSSSSSSSNPKEKASLKVIDLSKNKKKSCNIEFNDLNELKRFLENQSLSRPQRNQKPKHQISSILNHYEQTLQGILRGHCTYLRVVGVGYRVFLVKNILTLKLGFSHTIKIKVPSSSVRVYLPEPTLICLFGLDKNEVTQFAAKIKAIKPPSPYQGKGIRIIDDDIQVKKGKTKS